MTAMLLGVSLVALAGLCTVVALQPARPPSGIQRSLAHLEAWGEPASALLDDVHPPFAQRVLAPLRAQALRLGLRMTGDGARERLRRRLDRAGTPRGWDVEAAVTAKMLTSVALGIVGGLAALALGASLGAVLLVTLAGLALGYQAPELYLYQCAYDRSAAMLREMADTLDLLRISVEAGLGLDAALQHVARHTDGPLAEELGRVLREMQLGLSRAEALRAMAERSDLDDLHGFAAAMVQADAFGIPVADVLLVQSQQLRLKRRQRAEHRAQQVPVKITFPLVLFILPCLFVAVMGPAALSIMDSLT